MRGKRRLGLATLATMVALGPSISDAEESKTIRFREVTQASGLVFQHRAGATKQRFIHEVMGAGVCCWDFDQDGLWDCFFTVGEPTAPEGGPPDGNTLFRNVGSGKFAPCPAGADLRSADYSFGAYPADFDNDGDQDLFVTTFGRNQLFRNQGDGTFVRESFESFARSDFSTAAAWIDHDHDGDLDLYVVNYVDCDFTDYPHCAVPTKAGDVPIVCHPIRFRGQPDRFFVNDGKGHLTEQTTAAGLAVETPGRGLGAVACDLDQDGWVDLYVANDHGANFLFLNRQGRFIEDAVLQGAAYNALGAFEASMGVDAGDVNGDGRPELFMTHYYNETNTLYRNDGAVGFLDVTDEFGLGHTSKQKLGFGTSFADFDNDGWLDLFAANGHIHDAVSLRRMGKSYSSKMHAQVWRNRQGRYFDEASGLAGPYFQQKHRGRGSAVADFDNDGDADLLIAHLDDKPALLENVSAGNHHWIRIELVGRRANRDGLGSRVSLECRGRRIVRFATSGAGYLSTNDGRLLIGGGAEEFVAPVEVNWPGGASQHYPLNGRQELLIVEPAR